MEVRERRITK